LNYLCPLFYLLLLIAPAALSAPSSWYEVEVLIFVHLTSTTPSTETEPLGSGQQSSSGHRNVASAQGNTSIETKNQDAAFLPLSPRAWKLTGVAHRLNTSSHYRRLLHQAWKQIAASPQQAQPVHLHLPFVEATPQEAATFPNESLGSQLEGTVTLRRGRFLHVSLDLLYRQLPQVPVSPKAERETSEFLPLTRQFRLTESRRIRIQELHYFDHPAFGVLIQVRQSAAPKANAPDSPQTFPLESSSTQEISPTNKE